MSSAGLVCGGPEGPFELHRIPFPARAGRGNGIPMPVSILGILAVPRVTATISTMADPVPARGNEGQIQYGVPNLRQLVISCAGQLARDRSTSGIYDQSNGNSTGAHKQLFDSLDPVI